MKTEKQINSKKMDQILKTAEDLFKRFGIKRITIEEICKTANVSKMTFYKYFKNKKDLVKAMWNDLFEEGFSKLDEINSMEIPFTEKIEKILKLKEEWTKKLSREFINDYLYAEPEMRKIFMENYHKSMLRFLEFIKEAQLKGDVRTEMKPEFFLAVVNKLMELAHEKNLVNIYPTYKDFVLEVNNFIFYGILPANAHRE